MLQCILESKLGSLIVKPVYYTILYYTIPCRRRRRYDTTTVLPFSTKG